uniref:Uncharacterized protein n=1 Tax=Cannabis sativa TaxID=3483 RepID=A0A803PAQ6_CANSA
MRRERQSSSPVKFEKFVEEEIKAHVALSDIPGTVSFGRHIGHSARPSSRLVFFDEVTYEAIVEGTLICHSLADTIMSRPAAIWNAIYNQWTLASYGICQAHFCPKVPRSCHV